MKLAKEHPEIWALPLVMIVWVIIRPTVLSWLGSTNIILPDDTLQTLLFAAIALISAGLMAKLGIKLNFPALYKAYKEHELGCDTTEQDGKGKEQHSSSLFYFYLLYCVLIAGFMLAVIAIM